MTSQGGVVVCIARFRGMGEFVSDRTYTEEEAESLVLQLREVFRKCGISMGAYSRDGNPASGRREDNPQ